MTDLDALLRTADPARGRAPASDSEHATRIWADVRARTGAEPSSMDRKPSRDDGSRRRLARRGAIVGLAALAATVAGVLSIDTRTPIVSAEAAVAQASQRLAAADSGRIDGVTTYPTHTLRMDGRFSGSSAAFTMREEDGNGRASQTWAVVGIGTRVWYTENGVNRLGEENALPLHPFPTASAHVMDALLLSGNVTQVAGAGADATYEIVPDARSRAALAQLEPGELSWFDLEEPGGLQRTRVKLCDATVCELSMEYAKEGVRRQTTTRISHLGEPVTITPPAVTAPRPSPTRS